MNYFDLPEFATLADTTVGTTSPVALSDDSQISLARLVASIHRRAAAPSGYRFVANIAASALAQALLAVKFSAARGELKLITPAVDDAGNPVDDVALYVRANMSVPESFWSLFQSGGQVSAA